MTTFVCGAIFGPDGRLERIGMEDDYARLWSDFLGYWPGHADIRSWETKGYRFALVTVTEQSTGPSTFQNRVSPWMDACFGPEIGADRIERNHRFVEEALELVQACGCTKSEAHQLVDYVFDRPQGDVNQEVGGVMVTLAALCLANGLDMHDAGETELARVWQKIDKIRSKQAAKPKHSPLPQSTGPSPPPPGTRFDEEGVPMETGK